MKRLKKITAFLLCFVLMFGIAVNVKNVSATGTTIQDGWVTNDDGTKSYYKDGSMLWGSIAEIDGKYYGFDYDGIMYADTEFSLCYTDIDNNMTTYYYRAKTDGSLYCGEFYITDEGMAYYKDDCRMQEYGLFTVNGKTYYSAWDGKLTKFGTVIKWDGEAYYICYDGTVEKFSDYLEGEPAGKINIFSWNDELPGIVDTVLKKYPEYKDKIKCWDLELSGTSQDYVDIINNLSQLDATCIFSLDIDVVSTFEYKNVNYMINWSQFDALSSIGITEDDYADAYEYRKQSGKKNGELKLMTWQTCPNVFIYNKDIAEKVFGTSDSDKIQELIGTPEKFYEAAEKVKAAGYYMTTGVEKDGTIDVMVGYAQKYYTPVAGADDFIATLNAKGYTTGDSAWSSEWTADMSSGRVFGYFGTDWMYVWSMNNKDSYGICEGPVHYVWGGTYVGVSGTGKYTETDKTAAFILKSICCDADMMQEIAEKGSYIPNNKTAVANIIKNNGLYRYNGYVGVFDSAARKILGGADVVIEADEKTPSLSVSDDEEELIDSVFTEAEKASGLYLEVKITADTVEISALPADERKSIEEIVSESDLEIVSVLDINIFKILGVDETQITELDKPLTLTISIPEAFRNSNRSFYIIRVHDGKIDILKDLDNDPDTVTFETDKFSVYTLAYENATVSTKKEETTTETVTTEAVTTENTTGKDVTPSTGDNFGMAAIIMLMSIFGICAACVRIKKN